MKSVSPFMHVCIVMLLLLFPTLSRAQGIVFEKGIEVYGGMSLKAPSQYAAGANFIGALRFNPYLSLGAGLGYQYANALVSQATSIGNGTGNTEAYAAADRLKLFGRIKGNFTRSRISPIAAVDAGAAIKFSKQSQNTMSGFFAEPALGCDFGLHGHKVFAVFVGYQLQNTHVYSSLVLDGKLADMVDEQVFANLLTLHLGFYF